MKEPASDASPAHFFETINSHQRTAALKSAVELEIFTAIAEDNTTAFAIAERCRTAERGARILCDFLVINGFLTKQGEHYGLTADSAVFLDRRSPMYVGGAVDFLLSPTLTSGYENLTAAIRKGGTTLPEQGTVTPDHPIWIKFAQTMASLSGMAAQLMVTLAPTDATRDGKILDIAAGHGVFGIAFAQSNPRLRVVAQDWPAVLEVAFGNARAAGVGERYSTIPGNAFDVALGSGYDLVLLTNFLHHFDKPTCETLLRRVHAALADGGRALALDFIPDEDRVSPPGAAAFSMMMLGTTPGGDAYTFSEFDAMFRRAGFSRSELHELPPTLERLVISHK